ncbi:MAG: hypothetical protein WBE25_11715 [Xanthobacteraceae bacterium]
MSRIGIGGHVWSALVELAPVNTEKSNATIPLGRSARFAAAIEAHWQAFDLAQEETAHGRQELPAETQPTAAKIEAQS